MQNVNTRRLATKILSSLIALTLVLQPLAVGATAVSDAWLQTINGSSASVGSSSVPQYPTVTNVSASKWKMVSSDTTVISYTLGAYASNLQVNVYPNNGTYPVATLYNAFQNAGTYTANWAASGAEAGTYKVEVKATNALGVTAVSSTNVYIVPSASKATTLTNVSVSPSVFSMGQFTTISFTTDVDALVTVNVMPVGYNAMTEPVFSQDILTRGITSQSVTWDGTGKNGGYASAADYIVLVAALNDKAGVFSPEKTVRFDGQGYTPIVVAPGVSIFDVSPLQFDSVNTSLTVKYNLDAQATVTVTVKNQNGSTVYDDTRAASTTQIGFNQYTYGGQVTTAADQGQVAPYAKNGTYTVSVTAQNAAGTSTDSRNFTVINNPTQAIIQVVTPTTISNTTFTPYVFNVKSENATVSYTLSGSALAEFNVYNNGGSLVYTTGKVNKNAGSNSTIYTGYNQSGSLLTAGSYTYDVRLYDVTTGAFTTQSPNGSFQVNNPISQPPVIPTISIIPRTPKSTHVPNPTPFLSYTLSGSALAEFNVYNNGGSLVYTTGKVNKNAGSNSTIYTGYNQSGSLLASGTYTYDVRLYDASGVFLTQSPEGASFQVVNDPIVVATPTISNTTFTPYTFYVKNQNATVSYNLSANAIAEFNVFKSGSLVYTTGKVNKNAGSNSTIYTGYNQSGSLLTAGSYTYDVRLYDVTTGAFTTQSPNGSFQVVNDVTPPVSPKPYFSSVSFTPSTFNVWTEDAIVRFNLSASGSTRLNVFTSGGTQVYSGSQTNMSAGANTIVYAGFNNSNSLLSTGSYSYQLVSYETSGAQVDTANGSFQVVNTPIIPTNTTPYFQSVNFTPSTFDVRSTNASVSFSLQNSGNITFKIEDLNGNTVYNMSNLGGVTYLPNMTHTLTYTGVNNSGTLLPSGTYKYIISSTATVGSGTDTKSGYFTAVNNVVTPPPSYDAISTYNMTSSFDPRYGSARVSFTLVDAVFVVFRVEDSSGNVRYEKSTFFPKGYSEFAYDGRDNSGNLLANGTYTYKLLVFKANSTFETKQGSFTIMGQVQPPQPPVNAPVISSQYATPNPYNPDQGSLRLNYTLSTAAYATVTILKDNNIVKTIKINQLENGANSAVWDGKFPDSKFTAGANATAGTYTFRVAAYNSYGSAQTTDMLFAVSYSTTVQTPCAGFKDVSVTSAYCSAIEEMKRLGVFAGYNDGTFRPETPINRAETVKVIMMALKYNVPTTGWWFDSAGFKDINSSAWYTPYLAAARIYGVINGYPDNTFKPANTVNRVEMLKIFLEGANIGKAYVKCDKPYRDNTAGKWFTGYACIAKQYSLVDAVNGQFMAAKLMTRGDVAIMIYRAQILGLLTNLPPKKQVALPQLTNYIPGAFYPNQVQTTVFPPASFLPKY